MKYCCDDLENIGPVIRWDDDNISQIPFAVGRFHIYDHAGDCKEIFYCPFCGAKFGGEK